MVPKLNDFLKTHKEVRNEFREAGYETMLNDAQAIKNVSFPDRQSYYE